MQTHNKAAVISEISRASIPVGSPWFANRVNYQGITYTICRQCYEVIGSGRTESALRRAEMAHHCPAMDMSDE